MKVLLPIAVALGLLLGLAGFGIHFAVQEIDDVRGDAKTTVIERISAAIKRQNGKTRASEPDRQSKGERKIEEIRDLFENLKPVD